MNRNEIVECLAERRQKQEGCSNVTKRFLPKKKKKLAKAGTSTEAVIDDKRKARVRNIQVGMVCAGIHFTPPMIERIGKVIIVEENVCGFWRDGMWNYHESWLDFENITDVDTTPSYVIDIDKGMPALQNTEFELEFKYHYNTSPDHKIKKTEKIFAGILQEACDKLKNKYPNVSGVALSGKILKGEAPEVNLQNARMHMNYSEEMVEFSLRYAANHIEIMIKDCHGDKNILMTICSDGEFIKSKLSNNFLKHFRTINNEIKETE